MAQGSSTLLELELLPKPCITMKAGRFSPGFTLSGTRTAPESFRPIDWNEILVSDIFDPPCLGARPDRRQILSKIHVPEADAGVHEADCGAVMRIFPRDKAPISVQSAAARVRRPAG
jgi:hypothetical protein